MKGVQRKAWTGRGKKNLFNFSQCSAGCGGKKQVALFPTY